MREREKKSAKCIFAKKKTISNVCFAFQARTINNESLKMPRHA